VILNFIIVFYEFTKRNIYLSFVIERILAFNIKIPKKMNKIVNTTMPNQNASA